MRQQLQIVSLRRRILNFEQEFGQVSKLSHVVLQAAFKSPARMLLGHY
jgi:hypothetical protein